MLKPKDQEPRLPPSRVLVTRLQLRLTYGALIMLAGANVALVGGWWWQGTRDREVYVVVTDKEGVFAEVALARSKWEPEDAMWRNAAQDWLLNVRGRSLDPGEWQRQIKALVATTDRSQWDRLDEWLMTNQPTLRHAVDVEITEASTLQSTPTSGQVFMRWRERQRDKNGGVGDWSTSAITVTMAKGPPIIEGEERITNPFGLFVFGYSFNPLRPEQGESS